jgi:hypothetical protein
MSSNVCHQIIYHAIELSSSSWFIAYRIPRNDKAKLHRLEAGDGAGLLAFIVNLAPAEREVEGLGSSSRAGCHARAELSTLTARVAVDVPSLRK